MHGCHVMSMKGLGLGLELELGWILLGWVARVWLEGDG